jgi:hypothetical protein
VELGAAKTDDIREHDRGQAAGLASYCTGAGLGHSDDYRARSVQLSKSTGGVFLALAHPKE